MKKFKRYLILIFGLFLLSFNYNLLILPNTMVTGGASGLGVILQDFIDPSLFLLLINIVLIGLSFLIIGVHRTKDFILGSLLFPVFVYLTKDLTQFVTLGESDMILKVVFAAVISGFSIGIIIKHGFSTGGVDIAAHIMSKLANKSIGKSILLIDGFIITLGAFRFGLVKVMYAAIFVYILSVVTDRIILGISDNKAFYIVTSEEDKIKEFILNKLGHGASILQAKGGYKKDNKNILFCVIPSNEYFRLKEGINEIDSTAFFIVTDAYEVRGGA